MPPRILLIIRVPEVPIANARHSALPGVYGPR